MKCPVCHSDMPKMSGLLPVYEPSIDPKRLRFAYTRTVSPLYACLECHTVIWDDLSKERIIELKSLNKKKERSNSIEREDVPRLAGQRTVEELDTPESPIKPPEE